MTNEYAVTPESRIVQRLSPVEALHALSPVQMAVLGSKARTAGMTEADVVALIALVQDAAKSAAETAAQQTALAITPALLEFVSSVHNGTARRIAQRIARLPRSLMSDHRSCVEAAYAVAQEPASRYMER